MLKLNSFSYFLLKVIFVLVYCILLYLIIKSNTVDGWISLSDGILYFFTYPDDVKRINLSFKIAMAISSFFGLILIVSKSKNLDLLAFIFLILTLMVFIPSKYIED